MRVYKAHFPAFGAYLVELRESRKMPNGKPWTQSHAARQARVSRQTLLRAERGQFRNLTPAFCKALARVYQVPLDMLMDRWRDEFFSKAPFEIVEKSGSLTGEDGTQSPVHIPQTLETPIQGTVNAAIASTFTDRPSHPFRPQDADELVDALIALRDRLEGRIVLLQQESVFIRDLAALVLEKQITLAIDASSAGARRHRAHGRSPDRKSRHGA